jgi:fimbrial chaperone protein
MSRQHDAKTSTAVRTERRADFFKKRSPAPALITLLFLSLSSSLAFASDYRITPTTLELSSGAKSGAFSVINKGNEKLNVAVSVMEWTQDAAGKDVYGETKDIVFFPKIMTIEPNEQRAIRIGVKGPQSQKEKTYRLFVEELPAQKKKTDEKTAGNITAGLTIAFRFATPIFVKPARPQETAVIEKVELSKGLAKATVKNTGNVHIKVLSVTFRGKAADGKELFSKEISGWYVLHGLSRPYEMTVPKELCGNLATLEVKAQTENFRMDGTLNVQKNMCTQ